jgi:hypothetical protein
MQPAVVKKVKEKVFKMGTQPGGFFRGREDEVTVFQVLNLQIFLAGNRIGCRNGKGKRNVGDFFEAEIFQTVGDVA